MKNLLVPILVILSVVVSAYTSEQDLADHLLKNYQYPGTARPVKNSSESLQVNTGFTLTQILGIDLEAQTIDCAGWLLLTWKDEYLTWNPDDFDGIKQFNIASNRIWIPDVVLFNAVGPSTRIHEPLPAAVFSDGTVTIVVTHRLLATCPANPGDKTLSCKLKYGSWTYHEGKLNLQPSQDKVDVSYFTPHHDWELTKTSVERHAKKYPCCEETYVDVTFTLDLKARPQREEEEQKQTTSSAGQYAGSIMLMMMGLSAVELIKNWL